MTPPLLILILLSAIAIGIYVFLITDFTEGWERLDEAAKGEGYQGVMVSIIIPFRNEEKHLAQTWSSLSELDYPCERLEVFFVDDHSTDRGPDVLTRLISEKPIDYKVSLIRLSEEGETGGSKKAALTAGIKKASGTLIVTTDADCRFGPGWIKSIATAYNEKSSKLLWGPVFYERRRGLSGRFFYLEFLSLVTSGAGAAGKNKPFMCNGANLAFERKAFFDVGGYEGNERFASGDDVFLMHKIKRKYGPDSAFFIKSRGSLVRTSPPPGISGFISQRMRWASKSKGYKDRMAILVAASVYLVNLFLLALALSIIIDPLNVIPFIAAFIIKTIADHKLLVKGARFEGYRLRISELALFELIYIPYVVFTGLIAILFSYGWKGRSGVK